MPKQNKSYLEKPNKKKAKKISVSKWKDRLDKLVMQAVRLREKMICEKCGKRVSGQDAQTSHVKPKGLYPMLRFDLLNVQLLCYHCHIYWWHKDPLEASVWFEGKYPTTAKELERRALETRTGRFGQQDYEDIETNLKEKIKDYKNDRNLS